MTVCVLGDINVDLEMVLPEGTGVHANPEPSLSGGGSAANTAAALARLGVPTRFGGVVGDDTYGAFARSDLEAAGVDVSAVRREPGGVTVMVLVVVPPDGERIIYVWPPRGGAHAALTPADVETARAGAGWLHVSGIALRGEPAASTIIAAMAAARSDGVTISLDVNLRLENWGWENGFRTTIEAAIGHADVVFGGVADELGPLTGSADPVKAVAVLASGSRLVVGRLGEKGALADDGSGPVQVAGFEPEVVDTVGAGDAFDAGFIAARLRGADLATALLEANAVAALAITRPGARSTPTTQELEAFLLAADG